MSASIFSGLEYNGYGMIMVNHPTGQDVLLKLKEKMNG